MDFDYLLSVFSLFLPRCAGRSNAESPEKKSVISVFGSCEGVEHGLNTRWFERSGSAIWARPKAMTIDCLWTDNAPFMFKFPARNLADILRCILP